MSPKKLITGLVMLLLGLLAPGSVVAFLASIAPKWLAGWLTNGWLGEIMQNIIAGILISVGGELLWRGARS